MVCTLTANAYATPHLPVCCQAMESNRRGIAGSARPLELLRPSAQAATSYQSAISCPKTAPATAPTPVLKLSPWLSSCPRNPPSAPPTTMGSGLCDEWRG